MPMEANGDLEDSGYPFHEPNRQEPFLRHPLGQSRPDGQKRIENNIETLDYLRGISRLERDFVHLADKVVQTSLYLSHDCRNINREALDSTQLSEEVDNSWEQITHLEYMLQTHVKHAKRYHLFHLEIENLTRRLNGLEAHVEDLPINQAATEAAINNFAAEIQQSLETLVEAFMTWQKVNQRLAIVSPLHRRMPLPRGLHSGVLMASISLSSANGKVGRLLRAGTRVHVRANRPADLMHREWFLVDRSKGKEPGGLVIASVPSAFVWLDSPETSPERVAVGDEVVRRKVEVRRSQSALAIPQGPNNVGMVEDLRKHLFEVWEKSCSRFDQILRATSTLLLTNALTDSQTALSAEELARFDKALQRVSEFIKIFEFTQAEGSESLAHLLDDMKLRRDGRGGFANVDVNALDALVQAIDIFEEMVGCYQRYCSSKTPETLSKEEVEKGWYETSEKLDNTSKGSTESLQASIVPLLQTQPPVHASPVTAKVSHKTSSRASDSTKTPKTAHPKYKHRSLLIDGPDAENGCPYSPASSSGYGEHSVSWISRPSKTDKGNQATRSPSRGRKCDRFYRFLPILIRRHTQNKKKAKVLGDGEMGFSDNEASLLRSRIPSVSSKRLHRPYESLTLDRVNYTKKSESAKLHRTPLLLSTSALLNFADRDATPTGTSTLRRHPHWCGNGSPQRPSLLYSVACQNGVCVSCKMTEVEHPVNEDFITRKYGKKMQVGRSFTTPDLDVQGEKQAKDEKVTEMVEKDYIQGPHVYANIDPQSVYSLEQPIPEVALYDIGVQADLPNRLRGLRCRLEFERPGVELGDKGQLSCEAFRERFDTLSFKNVGGGEGEKADRNFKTLSFRVAFNNKPARSASTI